MRGHGVIGVRGTLFVLGALPMLIAIVSVVGLAVLIHRDASESFDHAEAIRQFEIVSGTLNEMDGEVALLDGWTRSGRLQSGETADVASLWIR